MPQDKPEFIKLQDSVQFIFIFDSEADCRVLHLCWKEKQNWAF